MSSTKYFITAKNDRVYQHNGDGVPVGDPYKSRAELIAAIEDPENDEQNLREQE